MNSIQPRTIPFDSLAEKLASVSHFAALSRVERRSVIDSGNLLRAQTGEIIFVEGDPSAGLYVLLHGRVNLVKLGPQGRVHILSSVDPVSMFNEVSALDGQGNVVTAQAVEDCLLWRADSDRVEELLKRFPTMALGLLKVVARRNRYLVSQYEDLSFRSVLARSAKLLLDLSDGGAQPINRRLNSNTEMAARIATGPEQFSRTLKIFKRAGHIRTDRTMIYVDDAQTLMHLAEIGPRKD